VPPHMSVNKGSARSVLLAVVLREHSQVCIQSEDSIQPPSVMWQYFLTQALANAMLAIVSHEALAARLRGHPPTFEMLRAFQVPNASTRSGVSFHA
jgi:hypothetical protein